MADAARHNPTMRVVVDFAQAADAMRRLADAWRRFEPTFLVIAESQRAEQRRMHQDYRRRQVARRRRNRRG